MNKVIKSNLAAYLATFIYSSASIIFFIEDYFIVALILAILAILSFMKKQIILDFLLIALFIIAMSSLTVFTSFIEMDKIKISLIEKILTVLVTFSTFLLYGYFLFRWKKPSNRLLILSSVFIVLAVVLAVLAW